MAPTRNYPTIEDVQSARQRLLGIARYTQLEYSRTFSAFAHADIYLKLENLQQTGSFKLRGAFNMIANLSEEQRRLGVIAASAGNHAQGVAFAARYHNVPCTIVMAESASLAKISATQQYGAEVVLHGRSYDDAFAHACQLQSEQNLTFVHAFDNPLIIAGQGTIGLEVLEQLPEVNAILVPMGGGGLATGVALAVKTTRPDVKIYGIEAANAACFRHSLDVGRLEPLEQVSTIADGIAVKRPGDLTYDLALQWIDDVITVEEEEIARAMVLLLERNKLVAEGAAASALAAAVYRKIPSGLGKVVVVLSGGNVDMNVLSRIIEHGLVESGRFLRLAVTLADRPGALRDLLEVFALLGANVISIQHHRVGTKLLIGQTEVEIDLETRNQSHISSILQEMRNCGYEPIQRD